MKLFFNLLLLTIFVTTLQGCSNFLSATSPDPIKDKADERSFGTSIDDEIIETKSLVNIDKAHPQLAQSHINVTSFNTVVLITGQVADQNLRQLAAQTIAKIRGVKRVLNELTVSGATSMVARSNDTWITTKVKSKLLANDQVQGSKIKIVTENGVVYLLGLATKEEADRAADITRKTAGVQKVVRIFEYIN